MDPWELFCHLCKTVVEEQDVYLDVLITPAGVEMMLMPMDEEDEDD
jgi:predicted RNA-binding protein associated with RNAse of E/G family